MSIGNRLLKNVNINVPAVCVVGEHVPNVDYVIAAAKPHDERGK